MDNTNTIYEILNTAAFALKLEQISITYPNLKQEHIIRNLLLEFFNSNYSTNTIRAFAEHPRISKINPINFVIKKERTDLSIVTLQDIANPFKIEIKFHFTQHQNSFLNYKNTIISQFTERKCNMFILVVLEMDIASKKQFDAVWGIDTHLERYQSKASDWKTNIDKCFKDAANCTKTRYLTPTSITVNNPYLSTYNFYVLTQ